MSWDAANQKRKLAQLLTPPSVKIPSISAPKMNPPMPAMPKGASFSSSGKFGKIKKMLGGM